MTETTEQRAQRRSEKGTVQIVLKPFPLALKRAIRAHADDAGTNMNDVAVSHLAAAFGFSFAPSGRKSPGLTDSDYISFEVPRTGRRKINARAAQLEVSTRDLIVRTLADRLNVRP